jgi:hypothetical protein
MYGLRQLALLWYNDLKALLHELGFSPIKADPCVFVNNTNFRIIVVYVNDLILVTKDTSTIKELKKRLFNQYKARDLELIGFYLSIRVHRDRAERSFSLTMDSYIDRVVEEYYLTNAPIADTLLPVSALKLTKRKDKANDNLIY